MLLRAVGEIVRGIGILVIGQLFVIGVPFAGEGTRVDVAAAGHLVHRIDQIWGAGPQRFPIASRPACRHAGPEL